MSQVIPPLLPEKLAKGRKVLLAAGSRKVPVRALLPNVVTLLGLCAGLTAMRMAIEGRFDMAIAAVIVAAILDGLDGRVARLLKVSSRFGAELDSLADFVNFGVAPALIIYLWGFGTIASLGWIVTLIFALATALRLARFNVALDDPDKPQWQNGFFVGVPAPAGAIVLLLPLYLEGLGLPHVEALTPFVVLYTIAIAFLTVSRLPTFSGKLATQKVERDYVPPLIVVAVLFAAVLATYPYLTLTAGTLLYLAVVPLSVRHYRRLERADAAVMAKQNGTGREA